MSGVKGVLVYASGKTETIKDPAGRCVVKCCDSCGSQMLFESASELAEDGNTVIPGSDEEARLFNLLRHRPEALADLKQRRNGGCIVYIQQKNR
jgi:hypothetical protein